MALSDTTPTTTETSTDAVCAGKAQRAIIRSIRTSRKAIDRVTAIVAASPGGKASINTELGATQTEVSAVLDKLVALVNAHKATGSADAANPLL